MICDMPQKAMTYDRKENRTCFKVWYSLKHVVMHSQTLDAVQSSVFALVVLAQFTPSLRPVLSCRWNKANL